MKKKTIPLRSVRWFGRQDIYGFIYRNWVKNRGPKGYPGMAEVGNMLLPFDHVLQASDGADLDFLAEKSGAFVPRDNH